MATAPSRVSLTIFVKPLCNVYIEKQLVNGGSIVPKPTGTWTGPGGKLEIRIEHTRKWSGEIMIDRSQSIEIDANNGQVKSNGKHIGWLR